MIEAQSQNRCPRCGGKMFSEGGDWYCISCGYIQYKAIVAPLEDFERSDTDITYVEHDCLQFAHCDDCVLRECHYLPIGGAVQPTIKDYIDRWLAGSNELNIGKFIAALLELGQSDYKKVKNAVTTALRVEIASGRLKRVRHGVYTLTNA